MIDRKEVNKCQKNSANDLQLHYEEAGSGSETIVFSHSYLADNSHFNPQIQKLKDRFHCLAFDHCGHGQSEIKKGSSLSGPVCLDLQ